MNENAAGMTYEARREALLEKLLPTPEHLMSSGGDLYGNRAIAALVAGRFVEEANVRIRRTAEWFEHPHPNGRAHKGECDFAAMKLARLYHMQALRDKIQPANLEAIQRFFIEHDFESVHGSENHALLFRVSRYLMASALPDREFQAYGRLGREVAEEDLDWLERSIRYRAAYGWGEFDSACYINPDFECLINLHDFAPDATLRRLSGMMLNLLLADAIVDSLNGMYCGAHGRIYSKHALDHALENTRQFFCLYFGVLEPQDVTAAILVDILTSSFRPESILADLTLHRTGPYENRERKHLHNPSDTLPVRPVGGSIRKYTYWNESYAMGCVQRQDPYPAGCPGSWYAHHEQHQWDLTFAGSTRARLFTHHPGLGRLEHGYWTGDIRCGCGSFFQNRSALIALYDIPQDQPYQFIHAYAPEDAFDDCRRRDGWVFVRKASAAAGLRMVNGHNFTPEGEFVGCEIRSPGSVNGVVCEAGNLKDFGGFDGFISEVLANPVAFDSDNRSLAYQSLRNGRLHLDGNGRRRFDDADADLEYPLFDCPYLKSDWGSGVIEIIFGDRRLTLDFTE
ncbi:hypothetical protein ACFLSJ_06610 [Verrucomicrobiota bacterium]